MSRETGKLKQNLTAAVFCKVLAGTLGALVSLPAICAWEPEKSVELIVPAGTGGDLDQRARLIQNIIVKYNLMKQPLLVVNKPGGAGAEGFLAVKNTKGDAHLLLLADNNLLSVPFFTGIPVNWKDMTPLAMLALEQFVLWTNAEKGYRSAPEYMEAVKAAHGKFKMGGAGSGPMPDHILTYTLGWTAVGNVFGWSFKYVPLKRAEVVNQLVEQGVDSTVNNPVEAREHWRAGVLTAQCVFDDTRMPYKTRVTTSLSWHDIPTCKEVGIPVEYQNLLGTFMPPGVSTEQVSYFLEVFKKMMATPEWQMYMENGAFKQTFKPGANFTDWLTTSESFHQAHAKRREQRIPK